MDQIAASKRRLDRAIPVQKLSRCQKKKARRRMALLGARAVAHFNGAIAFRTQLLALRRRLLRQRQACANDSCTDNVRTRGAALIRTDKGPRLVCPSCARKGRIPIVPEVR